MPNEITSDELEDDISAYEQREGEPPKYYEWFHVYMLMGPRRSLLGAYKLFHQKSKNVSKSISVSQSWKDAAVKWEWQRRALVWDDDQRAKRELEVDQHKRDSYTKWRTISDSLIKSATQMLSFPLVETSTADGKTIIEPANWRFSDIPKAISTAVNIGKAAYELEDKRAGGEISYEDEEATLEGSIDTLRSLGFQIIAPGEQPESEDDDEEE